MLPSASLFYFEGKGSGFLQNTDAIIYRDNPTPPTPQKKTSAYSLPRETKTYTLVFCVHIQYVADYRQTNKRNIPFTIISCK
jgi:hypothetical protein